MNPFSAGYYIKENRGRACLMIFMCSLSVYIFLGGNYVESMEWFWQKAYAYSDKIVMISCNSTDEEYKDYQSVLEDLKKDETLSFVERTAYGYGGMTWMSTLGFEEGNASYVLNSVSDMKKLFGRLGIVCDDSRLKNRSMVISTALARNKGIQLGDQLDHSFDDALDGTFTVDALIDDDSFITFYVIEDEDNLGRVYVYSDAMEGEALYSYVRNLCGDRNVMVVNPTRETAGEMFTMFYLIFIAGVILVSVILAVTIYSVITGQYLKRTYEFGVYRALGRRKSEIRLKCMRELLLMDGIGILCGSVAVVCFTYLMNVKYYIPKGEYLPYYSKRALVGFLICNILVIVPAVLGKGNQMARADVTEFS